MFNLLTTCLYRDGVSEGQFSHVLLFEMDAIRKVRVAYHLSIHHCCLQKKNNPPTQWKTKKNTKNEKTLTHPPTHPEKEKERTLFCILDVGGHLTIGSVMMIGLNFV